jgi:hypothetical protein
MPFACPAVNIPRIRCILFLVSVTSFGVVAIHSSHRLIDDFERRVQHLQ